VGCGCLWFIVHCVMYMMCIVRGIGFIVDSSVILCMYTQQQKKRTTYILENIFYNLFNNNIINNI
jgi:hypothetical protein